MTKFLWQSLRNLHEKQVNSFLQRRLALGVVVLPFNECWASFVAFRECRGKFRVGNRFLRRE